MDQSKRLRDELRERGEKRFTGRPTFVDNPTTSEERARLIENSQELVVVAKRLLKRVGLFVAARLGEASRRAAGSPGPVRQGQPCRCGRGEIRAASGRFGPFLGCSRFELDGSGCNYAWTIDGRRLPRRYR